MPLRLELFPKQRALIGTTCVQNVGSLTISLLIETFSKLIRGKYLITADQVDTTCKALHFTITQMYLADDPHEHQSRFEALVLSVSENLPKSTDALEAISRLVAKGEFYPALKESLALISLEAQASNKEQPKFNKPASIPARICSVELGPTERLIIGTAVVRNGENRARLLVDADANIIKGKHLLQQSEANTPCKRLYFVVQTMCMATESSSLMARFNETAHEVISKMPAAVPQIVGIHARVEERKFRQALAAGRELIAIEAEHKSNQSSLRKSA